VITVTASGSGNDAVPVFTAATGAPALRLADYARHPGGINTVVFLDGSARGVLQADQVDVTPQDATNPIPQAKIIYSKAETPK
jgi:prepilin-type processing-associated H-X9-DG protein